MSLFLKSIDIIATNCNYSKFDFAFQIIQNNSISTQFWSSHSLTLILPSPVKNMQGSTANHGEALRFEREDEDYLMYEEASPDTEASPPTTTFLTLDRASLPRKTKGRGVHQDSVSRLISRGDGRDHAVPERSIEGWIILVTGLHKEAQEDDLKDVFRDHGVIKNIKMNFVHRYGFVHSALIEYEHYEEAMNTIQKSNGSEFLTQTIFVDWAFITGPVNLRRY